MNYADRIKDTDSPQQALLVIAQGLDEILGALGNPSNVKNSAWGEWGTVVAAPGMEPASGAPDPPATAPEYTPVVIPVDQAQVEMLELAYEQANNLFEQVRLTGDKGATVAAAQRAEGIRGRLDLARNPGSVMPVSGDMVGDGDFIKVERTADEILYDLPDASDELKAKRRELAETVDLPGSFAPVKRQTEEARQEIIENYVQGGPLWLYLGDQEGRKIVMSQPNWARYQMVMDVAETTNDGRFTHEFTRDVMKDEEPDVLGVDGEKEWAHGVMDRGGAPYQGRDAAGA